MTATISETCWDAVAWIDELAQADADTAIQTLIDRVIAVLRRDPRMPTLTGEAWRLLLADAAARSRDELGELIDGRPTLARRSARSSERSQPRPMRIAVDLGRKPTRK
jgi:hypothetical protein